MNNSVVTLLITYNSHPWMFSFSRLVIIWTGEGVRLKLEVHGQGQGRNSNAERQVGWGLLKNGQFSWTSFVYRP